MKRIGMTSKKFLLTLHILFSAIMFGVAIAFLILSIVAATSKDESVLLATYTSMNLLAETSVRASTIGAVITGILLSILTHWGLFRYYWIILKELLTILSIGLGIVGIYVWSLNGLEIINDQGINTIQDPEFIVNQTYLFIGIGLQIISLGTMFFLSVFKPWGKRK